MADFCQSPNTQGSAQGVFMDPSGVIFEAFERIHAVFRCICGLPDTWCIWAPLGGPADSAPRAERSEARRARAAYDEHGFTQNLQRACFDIHKWCIWSHLRKGTATVRVDGARGPTGRFLPLAR